MDGTAPRTALVMYARVLGSPLQADCSRFLGFELNTVSVRFVVVSNRGEVRRTPFPGKDWQISARRNHFSPKLRRAESGFAPVGQTEVERAA
jgi:hypothetical protein